LFAFDIIKSHRVVQRDPALVKIAWMMSPSPPEAGSWFDRTDVPGVAKRIERARRGERIDAIGCPPDVQQSIPRLRDRAEARSIPNSEGFREQALSGLERRALFVFSRSRCNTMSISTVART